MNHERRQQIRAWYSDPVRKLPRKVVRDVIDLLDACEQHEPGPLNMRKARRQLIADGEVTRGRGTRR